MKEHHPRHTGREQAFTEAMVTTPRGREGEMWKFLEERRPLIARMSFFTPHSCRKEAMDPHLAGLWSTVVLQKAQGLSIFVIWTRSLHTYRKPVNLSAIVILVAFS